MKQKISLLTLGLLLVQGLSAQCVLTLDSLRARALTESAVVKEAKAQQEQAYWTRRAAQTNYLPKISLSGGYMRTGRELSLLSDEQKASLSSFGTNTVTQAGQLAQQMAMLHPELAPLVQQVGTMLPALGAAGDAFGAGLVNDLRTDTRNIAAAAILLKQPLYMGGKIRAYDRITHLSEDLATERLRQAEHEALLGVDEAYWQVVSLGAKCKLAAQYRDLLQAMKRDVEKMEEEGVATRAQVLQVDVRLSEAEMTVLRAEDGMHLARLLLAQRCGLPLDLDFRLADEGKDFCTMPIEKVNPSVDEALAARPELRQASIGAEIYDQKVRIERSSMLPQLALTGGYGASLPSMFNGFEKKFRGTWAVGVMLNVPIWQWGEGRDKVRAARAEASLHRLQWQDAREKVDLQVRQAALRVNEAATRYQKTDRLITAAEENLRVAQVGHTEGVVTTTDLLAASTAWLSARSEQVDAAVDMLISRAIYNKVCGQ